MKGVKFKHQTSVHAENQPQYQSLPTLKLDTPEGHIISCWKLSFKERIKVLFFGRVWMSLLMFGNDLTPSHLSVNRKEVYSHPDDSIVWYKKLLTFTAKKAKTNFQELANAFKKINFN